MSLEVGQTADRGDRFPVTGRAAQPGAADTDGPLIGDAAGLRASWHRIQAGFVDDPREAVADAAALVEHAAQVLVGTLRQRQQQLRGMWDTTAARDAGSRTTGAATTDPAPTGTDPAPTGRMPVADGTRAADETRATDGTRAADSGVVADSGAPPGGVRATDGTRTADSGVVADSGAPAGGVRATDAAAAAGSARAADNAGDDSAGAADTAGGQASGYPQVPDPRAGGYPGARARGDAVGASRAAAGGVPDTEQLRLLMRRYRSLLEQICPPQ
jgi:hypothetical protein